MVITRVNALSVAKVAAVLYAGIGFLLGALFSLIGMVGVGAALSGQEGAGFISALFGVGAIVIMPICYAIIGFIFSFIAASLFNVAAGMTGGIEVETRQA
ncbi:MAG TPA: hypothetical protein VMZ90_06125 [Vicinamibacterales bacterium]|nr:hypothetical protein [Vicinamibacterales bacterium]